MSRLRPTTFTERVLARGKLQLAVSCRSCEGEKEACSDCGKLAEDWDRRLLALIDANGGSPIEKTPAEMVAGGALP